MRRPIALAAATVCLLGLFAGPATAHPVRLTATLTAEAEVPKPGPVGAVAAATVTVDHDTGEVCYDLTGLAVLGLVTMGHIHRGAAGVSGPVVVDLAISTTAGTDIASGCVTADKSVVADIEADPAAFYVNLHTPLFPAGAVRGQLAPAG